jgi:hypothetical protein
LLAQNIGAFIKRVEEIVEYLEMEGRSQQAPPLPPLITWEIV